MSELKRLQKEAEFLSKLIQRHKTSSETSSRRPASSAPTNYRQWTNEPSNCNKKFVPAESKQVGGNSHKLRKADTAPDPLNAPPRASAARSATFSYHQSGGSTQRYKSSTHSYSWTPKCHAQNAQSSPTKRKASPPQNVSHIQCTVSSSAAMNLTASVAYLHDTTGHARPQVVAPLAKDNVISFLNSSKPIVNIASNRKTGTKSRTLKHSVTEGTGASIASNKHYSGSNDAKVVETSDKLETAQNLLRQLKESMTSGASAQTGNVTKIRTPPIIDAIHNNMGNNFSKSENKYKFVKGRGENTKAYKTPSRTVIHRRRSTVSLPGILPSNPKAVPSRQVTPRQSSKYKYVKGQPCQSKSLSSLMKSPELVVKLRTKYKLVKKAKQVKRTPQAHRHTPYRVNKSPKNYKQTMARQYSFTHPHYMSPGTKQYYCRPGYGKLYLQPVRSTFGRFAICKNYRGPLYRKKMLASVNNYNRFGTFLGRQSPRYSIKNFSFQGMSTIKPGNSIMVKGDSKYLICQKGKSLRRVSKEKPIFPNVGKLKSTKIKAPSNVRVSAFRALQRSKYVASSASQKTKKPASEFCKFFNRFGRCCRGEKCKYIHDSNRVALCTRFLRGTCKVTDCPFSHNVTAGKIPVCSYFLKGKCSREDCPYLHVNVSRNAETCHDFVNGFCPRGNQCEKQHSLICPDFQKNGECKNGKKCALKHLKKSLLRKRNSSQTKLNEPGKVTKRKKSSSPSVDVTPNDDANVPLKERTLPSYISLSTASTSTSESPARTAAQGTPSTPAATPILIKPRFSFMKN